MKMMEPAKAAHNGCFCAIWSHLNRLIREDGIGEKAHLFSLEGAKSQGYQTQMKGPLKGDNEMAESFEFRGLRRQKDSSLESEKEVNKERRTTFAR